MFQYFRSRQVLPSGVRLPCLSHLCSRWGEGFYLRFTSPLTGHTKKNYKEMNINKIKRLYQKKMVENYDAEECAPGRARPKVRTRAALSNALAIKATNQEIADLWGINVNAIRYYKREHKNWLDQDLAYPTKYKLAIEAVAELTRPLNAIALKPIYGETPEEMVLIVDHTIEVLTALKEKIHKYS